MPTDQEHIAAAIKISPHVELDLISFIDVGAPILETDVYKYIALYNEYLYIFEFHCHESLDNL